MDMTNIFDRYRYNTISSCSPFINDLPIQSPLPGRYCDKFGNFVVSVAPLTSAYPSKICSHIAEYSFLNPDPILVPILLKNRDIIIS